MKKSFFSEEDIQKIVAAIQKAESISSAEIRVHVEQRSFRDPMKMAATIFHKLKMEQTKLRNGVLLYFSAKNHKFAIIGDEGIHTGVPADFWKKLARDVTNIMQTEPLTNGICASISYLGNALRPYFPVQANDVNELNNDISIGDK